MALPNAVRFVESADLAGADQAAILGGNAARLLKIKRRRRAARATPRPNAKAGESKPSGANRRATALRCAVLDLAGGLRRRRAARPAPKARRAQHHVAPRRRPRKAASRSTPQLRSGPPRRCAARQRPTAGASPATRCRRSVRRNSRCSARRAPGRGSGRSASFPIASTIGGADEAIAQPAAARLDQLDMRQQRGGMSRGSMSRRRGIARAPRLQLPIVEQRAKLRLDREDRPPPRAIALSRRRAPSVSAIEGALVERTDRVVERRARAPRRGRARRG